MFLGTVDPTREGRMEAILRVLDSRSRAPIRVLELGTGPGSLTDRILKRFPASQVVGVDSDPVLLRVGEQALAPHGSRVAWLLADLRKVGWSAGLPAGTFDAVATSLALHWLEEGDIERLYGDVHRLLRPGGLLVNGDFLPSEPAKRARRPPRSARVKDRPAQTEGASLRDFRRLWTRWWGALVGQPGMLPYFRERQRRMPGSIPPRRTSGPQNPATVEFHVRALRSAGFRETAVVWRENGFRVLVGTS